MRCAFHVATAWFVLAGAAANLRGEERGEFVWSRSGDFTSRPAGDRNTCHGNPANDRYRRPAWSYEYFHSVPDGAALGEGNTPWFVGCPTRRMVWDPDWWGSGTGTWAVRDECGPTVTRPGLSHINCDTEFARYSHVPAVRWRNLTGKRLLASVAMGANFQLKWAGTFKQATPFGVDVAIALVDASDGGRCIPLYARTFAKPTDSEQFETLDLPRPELPEVRVDPNDQIILTFRARQRYTGGGARWVSLMDDLSIKGRPLKQGAAPPAQSQPAGALDAGRIGELWKELADPNAARASETVAQLARGGDAAAAFVAEQCAGAAPDDRRIAALIADLDAESWRQRERADKELRALGPRAAAALQTAARTTPSEEVRVRATALLAALCRPTDDDPRTIRLNRAVRVLRRIGSKASVEALRAILAHCTAPDARYHAQAAMDDLRAGRQ